MNRRMVAWLQVGVLVLSVAVTSADDLFSDGIELGHLLRWSRVASGLGDCSDLTIVDDMEDGDLGICPNWGRFGAWYAAADDTPGSSFALAVVSLVGGHPGSSRSISFAGDPFASWGAVCGFALDEASGTRVPYDISGYSAIRFWARAAAATTIAFKIPTVATVPEGGVCTTCNDHYGAYVPLTTSWQEHLVDLGGLAQQGWGDPVGLDLTTALSLEWFTGTQVAPWQIWIDHVELVTTR